MSANNEVNANTEISEWMLDGSLLYRLQFGVNCDEINVTMTNRSRKEYDRAVVAGELLKHLSIVQPVAEPVAHANETPLEHWLAREMPAGTVIGDPAFWARKLTGRFNRAYSAGIADGRLFAATSLIPSDLLTRTIDVLDELKEQAISLSKYDVPCGLHERIDSVLADLRKIGGDHA